MHTMGDTRCLKRGVRDTYRVWRTRVSRGGGGVFVAIAQNL